MSFSNNKVNSDSFIPNEKGLTFATVDECIKKLEDRNIEYEHICMNNKDIRNCRACGARGWGMCYTKNKCVIDDEFNEIYEKMSEFDGFVFVTPVYFWEMSESAKTFFDRLKRCDAFNENSKLRNKKMISIACAGGSGNGTENTLKAFEVFNHFMKMEMIGRIPVTKFNFEEKINDIKQSIVDFINKSIVK